MITRPENFNLSPNKMKDLGINELVEEFAKVKEIKGGNVSQRDINDFLPKIPTLNTSSKAYDFVMNYYVDK